MWAMPPNEPQHSPGERRHSRRRLALNLTLLSLLVLGCMSAPQPGDATVGVREIGADYTNSAVARWACDGGDFILAETPQGLVVHDLDTDIVARNPERAPAGLVFRASDGVVDRTYLVPLDRNQPASIRSVVSGSSRSFSGLQANGSGGTTQINVQSNDIHSDDTRSCAPAPRVSLL